MAYQLDDRALDPKEYRDRPSASFPWLACEVSTAGGKAIDGNVRFYRVQYVAKHWCKRNFRTWAVGRVNV